MEKSKSTWKDYVHFALLFWPLWLIAFTVIFYTFGLDKLIPDVVATWAERIGAGFFIIAGIASLIGGAIGGGGNERDPR